MTLTSKKLETKSPPHSLCEEGILSIMNSGIDSANRIKSSTDSRELSRYITSPFIPVRV